MMRFGLLGIIVALLLAGAVAQSDDPQKVTISQAVSEGLLIYKAQPSYPPLARQARVEGTVVLHALIGKDGTVQELTVISGHPMLIQAAMDAVKQWRYKPSLFNGEPILVQTTITINFQLNGAAVDTAPHESSANNSSPESGSSDLPRPPPVSPGATADQDPTVHRVGAGVSAPKLIYDPDPEYSEKARKAKYQGTVVLWLVVGADGLPREIKVQRSLGMGLDEEAVKAVKNWRFEPSTKDGHPVSVMINVEINFRLYGNLVPHPDSSAEPPRFPGINTSKYPLIVRLGSVSFSGSDANTITGYQATVLDAGQARQISISCKKDTPHCIALENGTYPARWENNMATIEILGLRESKGKWEQTEYSVAGKQP